MMRTIGKVIRFVENYRHYRKQGIYFRDAWHLASMTLP
jgi:hypothetical protein